MSLQCYRQIIENGVAEYRWTKSLVNDVVERCLVDVAWLADAECDPHLRKSILMTDSTVTVLMGPYNQRRMSGYIQGGPKTDHFLKCITLL